MRSQNKLTPKIDNSPNEQKENIKKANIIFPKQTSTVKSNQLYYTKKCNPNRDRVLLQVSSDGQEIIREINKKKKRIQQLIKGRDEVLEFYSQLKTEYLDAQLKGNSERVESLSGFLQGQTKSLEFYAKMENMQRDQILQLKKKLLKLWNQEI